MLFADASRIRISDLRVDLGRNGFVAGIVGGIAFAVSLLGSRMDWLTVAFVGWFGPRGFASVVFALITLEDLHDVPGPVQSVVGTIGLTVLLSVLAHGLSARPLAGLYAATQSDQLPTKESEPIVRRLVSKS